ncbi:MAG TPA: hypothetical protein VIY48_10045 [Candidatus Paceibacterota bacterium]
MERTLKIVSGVVIAASLLAPLSAYALGTSFGGRIVAAVPCLSPLGPSIWFTIVPSSLYPVFSFIWTPATVTYLAGPPRNPGQQVLGVADTAFACKVGIVPFFGQRVQIIGTSGAL